MTSTFQFLFLFLIIFTVMTQIWLSIRHIRHVKHHRSNVPNAFKSIIKSKDHQKAADYTVAKSKLNIIDLLVQAIFLYVLTIGGLINWLNDYISSLDLNSLISGSIVIISVMVLSSLIDLPANLFKTFNIDEKFGFNRMSIKIFILDGIKQLLLSVVIGLPILFTSLWIIGNLGGLWWLWLWAFISLFNFAMLSLYPIYIAPLFNKFQPLGDTNLKNKIEKLLLRCGFKSSGLFVMNGSLRSNHGNAYFTGFGKSKRIVFFDTLLEKLSKGPRQVLNLPTIKIEEGESAKLTLLDAHLKWHYNEESNVSKSNNSPLFGHELTGKAVGVINGEKSYFPR